MTIYTEPIRSTSDITNFGAKLLGNYRYMFTGITVVCILLIIAGLIIAFTKLAGSGANAQKNEAAKTQIGYAVIALIVVGSLTSFASMFFYLFR